MVGNESLSRMVYSMDLLDKFMTVLVEGWSMVGELSLLLHKQK